MAVWFGGIHLTIDTPRSPMTPLHSRPLWLSSGRIPSLDGLRAVAILSVILCHIIGVPGSPLPESWVILRKLGPAGVDVFFVVSGFLITHLLLCEIRKTGRVSLKGFWLRRSLRILPGYLFLVAFMFTLSPCRLLLCG